MCWELFLTEQRITHTVNAHLTLIQYTIFGDLYNAKIETKNCRSTNVELKGIK